MHLVNSTTAWLKRIVGLSFALFFYTTATAQENSPYSRYGLGDVILNQNIASRGMGGVSIADSSMFSINFKNPASLASLSSAYRRTNIIFDIGGEIDIRTLKSTTATEKYTSTNTLISYLQVAFPIASKKMEKRGIKWGLSFGVRPITRVNYKIEKNERLSIGDSLNTLYEGSGGLNQVNISTGIKIKNFSFGVSSGYTFGNKNYSTELVFVNDTVPYLKSHTGNDAHYGGIFLNLGAQYQVNLHNKSVLNFGAFANLQQSLRARQDHIDETFAFDGFGGITAIDTISSKIDQKGTVKLPATYGFGLSYQDSSGRWNVGADFELTTWDSYSYFGEKDLVQNSWVIRVGAEYLPITRNPTKNYWRSVKYRAGFYIGPDYVKLDKSRINYAGTIGASFPLTNPRLYWSNTTDEPQYVQLNTAIEYGGRGNQQSFSFRENTLRFCIGISMNARWFQKRSYY